MNLDDHINGGSLDREEEVTKVRPVGMKARKCAVLDATCRRCSQGQGRGELCQ